MKLSPLPIFAAMALAWPVTDAHAAISCGFNAGTGINMVYNPTTTASNTRTGTFSVTCTRSLTTDPLSVTFTAKNDEGIWNAGSQNRAKLTSVGNCGTASNCILYDLFITSALATQWRKAGTINGTVSFATATTMSATASATYYFGSTAAQTVATGNFADTVTLTLAYAPGGITSLPGSPASFPVNISTSANCVISTPPNTLNLNYTSFQNTAAANFVGFAATCTTGLSYTVDLSPTSGTLLGLPYSVSLNSASVVSSLSVSGNGSAQPYSIYGKIAASLSGNCTIATCSAVAPHIITIAY
jgi:spore coat protein U-like protein